MENLKKLLSYVILPQCIMALLLALCFVLNRQMPGVEFSVVFIFEIILNIVIFCYYLKNKQKEKIGIKALYFFLFAYFIVFSFGICFLYRESLWFLNMSAPVLYLLFNAFSMFCLAAEAVRTGSEENKKDIMILSILCVVFPVVIYILFGIFSFNSLSMVMAVGFFCIFLFLIGRQLYMSHVQGKKNIQAGNDEKEYTMLYRILVLITGIGLPMAGLYLNWWLGNVLGDFSSKWFFIIALLNGLVLLFDIKKIPGKLLIFYLKIAGFVYIVYFAVVFIPYIPLGLMGIAVYGMGLLVFAPAAAFYVQLRQIIRDIRILKKKYSNNIIIFTALIGVLTLPFILAANFKIDGINFNKAMVYMNSGENIQEEVNMKRLDRSITQIKNTMRSTRDMDFFAFNPGTPLISTIYRYIALDNRFFTEKSAEKIQKIFTPEKVVSESEVIGIDKLVNVDFYLQISTRDKEYIKELGAYKIWVDMEITLIGDRFNPREYRTNFILPDGSFITDYYLYVGEEKKRGIMTDKRAAQTAYDSIIRTQRDPGIIYYDNDNKLSLRVFPFPFEESYMRKTGFQIMYSQNGSFSIDGKIINLEAENAEKTPIQLDGIQYIPADYKKSLPKIERKPQYYFLIDAGKKSSYKKHIELAKKYTEEKNLESPVYYAVSYQSMEIKDINSKTPEVISEGGFNTAYTVEKIFSSVPQGKFPVIIMVTDNMNRVVEFEKTQLAKVFPENDYYYRLNSDLSLIPFDFYSNDILQETDEIITNTAVNYNGTVIKNDDKSEIIYDNKISGKQAENDYEKAFVLQKNAIQNKETKDQIAGIKEAMQKRILTKNTAFIVMETKEQEEMLLELQEKFLNGKGNETPSVMMSEAGWLAMAAVVLIVVFLKGNFYRKKNGKKS